jgi:uncharacterized LabA/DUF88 family protein
VDEFYDRGVKLLLTSEDSIIDLYEGEKLAFEIERTRSRLLEMQSDDYAKFRLYLKNKYNVDKAFMFIGLVQNNQKLYTALQAAGFILIFKPTIRYFENGRETVKGNVDAELVLHASAIEFDNYDKAIIVSGDGDFACLVEYLDEQGKLLKVMTPNAKYSKLLKPFSTYIIQINKLKKSLEYKKASIGGRSKP